MKVINNIGIAVFVKTRGISPIKTRLAKTIGKEKAEDFYFASVQEIKIILENAIKHLPVPTFNYWALTENEKAHPYWPDGQILNQGVGNLGERLFEIYNLLIKKHDAAILIGSDTPQITIDHFIETSELLLDGGSVIGPSPDGGFYLFGSSTDLSKETFTSVAYSQSTTLKEFESKVKKYGKLNYIESLIDVDEYKDLEKIKCYFEGISETTSPVARWLKKNI